MRKLGKVKVALVLAALVGAAGNGLAMDSLKPGKQKVKPITAGEFADLRAKLGACIVRYNKAKVNGYLQHSDSVTIDYKAMGTDQMQFMFYFNMQPCANYNVPQMTQQVFMAPGGLRNLLLEAVYLDAVKSAPQPAVDDKGEPTAFPARSFPTTTDALASVKMFAALADCTAAKNPAAADAVLRASFNLPDEKAAAVALAPTIGTCVQTGQNISLTSASIRTLAAEGLWSRYASGNPAQASAK